MVIHALFAIFIGAGAAWTVASIWLLAMRQPIPRWFEIAFLVVGGAATTVAFLATDTDQIWILSVLAVIWLIVRLLKMSVIHRERDAHGPV
jgi:hypothetical protein